MAESALELRDSVLNRRIVTDMQSEQFIPALFKNPDFIYEKYFLYFIYRNTCFYIM